MAIREVLLRLRYEKPPETRFERLEYAMHPIAIAALFRELRDDLDQSPVGPDGRIWMFGIPVCKDADRDPENIELRESPEP